MPTRCLPDDYDIPRPFGPPTPEQVGAILTAYDTTVTASTWAARALEDLTLCIDAPSAPLATARKLARLAEVGPETHREYDSTELRRAARRRGESHHLGPVERRLINLGVTDALTLLQAAAIDHTGRNLIASAKEPRLGIAAPHPAPQDGSLHESVSQVEPHHRLSSRFPDHPRRGPHPPHR